MKIGKYRIVCGFVFSDDACSLLPFCVLCRDRYCLDVVLGWLTLGVVVSFNRVDTEEKEL